MPGILMQHGLRRFAMRKELVALFHQLSGQSDSGHTGMHNAKDRCERSYDEQGVEKQLKHFALPGLSRRFKPNPSRDPRDNSRGHQHTPLGSYY